MWGGRTDAAAQTAVLSPAPSSMVQQLARMTVADLPHTSHPQLLLCHWVRESQWWCLRRQTQAGRCSHPVGAGPEQWCRWSHPQSGSTGCV